MRAAGRQFWVVLHRWTGLSIALFLVVAGVTGSVLAFVEYIEPRTAPDVLTAAPPTPDARPFDPLTLRDQALRRYPDSVITYLPLQVEPGRSFKLIVERVDPATGRLTYWSPEWNELFVDPYTGEELGRRTWGDISEGPVNLVPFLYRLHWALALDPIGIRLFGVVALVWTVNCFVGLYLSFPARVRREDHRRRRRPGRWLARWKPAWLVRLSRGRTRFNFDLHRAGDLWIWPVLLVFAWSSVFMNLAAFYDPLMRLVGYEEVEDEVPVLDRPEHDPRIGFREAVAVGATLAAREAAQRDLTVEARGERVLYYRPDLGVYVYSFTASNDFTQTGGKSSVVFDATSGRVIKTLFVAGERGANTVTNWLEALHLADVWGMPYRIAVALIGLAIPVLSITGLLIWLKKRRARIDVRARRERAAALAARG